MHATKDIDVSSAECFGYARIGLGSDDENTDEEHSEQYSEQWTPNVSPDMPMAEFEAEVVRAARYGASLHEQTNDELEDDQWQEAEVIVGDDTAEVPAANPHSASWDTPLSQESVEAIRLGMQGFALPADAAPSWAIGLSDEAWMQAIHRVVREGK